MIALEHKDTPPAICEASIKCLQNNGHLSILPENDPHGEVVLELQNELSDQSQESYNKIDQDCLLNSEHPEPSEECMQQPVYHHNYGSWPAKPGSNSTSLYHMNAFQGQFHPSSVHYRFQCAPVNMFTRNLCDYQFQDFHYFVVIDFEATCDQGKVPHPQEIIEFPSVIVSSITGQLEACFQTYVRPTCNQVLSDFCKDLTGIQQMQVDRGVTLGEALLRHDKWLEKKGIKSSNFAVVTWSNWDCRVMLESECRFKKIRKPPYFNRWINLRVPFREVFGGVQCNLKEAVETAGLTWQGRAHCGLDDAKNTARLLALIMRRGFKFSLTNSLSCQTSNGSSIWKPTEERLIVSPQPLKLWELRPPLLQYNRHCYCGVASSKGMIRKPGPRQGSLFFGCGNWTAARGARCQYFEWVSP